jgi:hypothetical protein
MSFSYSVGNFFAAVSLIVEVGLTLRDAGGSAYEYQQITSELSLLKTAL